MVIVALALCGMALGGCSTLGLPFGSEAAVDTTTVGSIPVSAKLSDSVNPSDWETIQRTVAAVPSNQSQTVEWTNSRTGSTGTVIALAASGNASCRAFATTISDPRGVRRYSGQVCRQLAGQWRLKSVSADDALFS
jgi:surface antigen